MGRGISNILFIPMFVFIYTQLSRRTYEKLFVQFNVSFYFFCNRTYYLHMVQSFRHKGTCRQGLSCSQTPSPSAWRQRVSLVSFVPSQSVHRQAVWQTR